MGNPPANNHDKFRVELPALEKFGDYAQRQIPETPESKDLQGNPVFGRRDQSGPRALAEQHELTLKGMERLVDQIKGGVAATEQAIHQITENYKQADDNARARIEQVNATLDDWEKPKGQQSPSGKPPLPLPTTDSTPPGMPTTDGGQPAGQQPQQPAPTRPAR